LRKQKPSSKVSDSVKYSRAKDNDDEFEEDRGSAARTQVVRKQAG
jgi:hypothetical protein